MNDNLAGQLWFGAECLAAGSSIMNKEGESESMRPLAKAVTKSLEKVRALLREQCLSPQPEYTESIREHLKIFDRLFADFEFNYVRCMVHVKTTKEYELHQVNKKPKRGIRPEYRKNKRLGTTFVQCFFNDSLLCIHLWVKCSCKTTVLHISFQLI